MRILGSTIVGALALLIAMPAHADPQGPKFSGGRAFAIVQPSTGSVSRPVPGPMGQGTNAWGSLHWGSNRAHGAWGPHRGWAGPYTVWGAPYVPYVWGGPYVPYPGYGDWGALWYPYAEWRGPTGGWGNP